MDNNKKIKEIYQELLDVYNKHSGEWFLQDHCFSDFRKSKKEAERHLSIIEWNEKYWLNIRHDIDMSNWHFKINDYMSFSYFNDAAAEKERWYGRYISWSDDWTQPKNEWLLWISFSTWAYIFWDDYPKHIFEAFWQELKSYNPKYIDTANKGLYFWIEDCKDIFNSFDDILKKHNQLNKEDYKKRKREKLEKQLKELED